MNSKSCCELRALSRLLLWVLSLVIGAGAGNAQVSPAEVLDPQLKAAEETYLPQLETLNRTIAAAKFPFPFFLSRYVGLDPQKQIDADTRGLEFVRFHDRRVLKVTGNYNAAYNADRLTQNQRASRVFQEVVTPILQLVAQEIPADVSCDAVGFEISYHVRRRTRNYDYEGKEILVVVLNKSDAFGFFNLSRGSDRQEILNRSEIYLSGKEFGLALDEREPFNVEALERSVPHRTVPASEPVPVANASKSDDRLARINQDLPPGFPKPDPQAPVGTKPASPGATPLQSSDKPGAPASHVATATPGDVERFQVRYKAQLEALAKEGVAKFHFVDYSPPSFVAFRNQVYLQLTLRNTLRSENPSSIYKRAAQSFDLFLAPQLKDLLERVPTGADFAGLDITLLNQLTSKSAPSSEAVEFICPLAPLRRFVDAEITNQDLINQSVVLVNGVRIALNLQQVE